LVARLVDGHANLARRSLRSLHSTRTTSYPRYNVPRVPPNGKDSAKEISAEDTGLKEPEVELSARDDEDASSKSASGSGGTPAGGEGESPPSQPPPPTAPTAPPQSSAITKQSVPEVYPQLLALPIARRPLFPGFYKAVVIRNPSVVAAVKDMMKRGQPYLGAFLLKDENSDSDVITNLDSVYPVGVFAQITSVFSVSGGPPKEDEKEEGITAVLYPHRRIRISSLAKEVSSATIVNVEPLHEQPVESSDSIATPEPQPTEITPSRAGCRHICSPCCISC
jgi:ATP-dependent Lon protease